MSPQALAPPGMAAVLDLRIPSLRFEPLARALADLRRATAPTVPLHLTEPCLNAKAHKLAEYVAPVSAAGVTDLMMIDTGATRTIFSDGSKIAHAIGGGREVTTPTEGIGGEVTGERLVRNVKLLRGGRIVTLNPSIGEVSASCHRKGILGMDALRSCLLILGDRKMAISCD